MTTNPTPTTCTERPTGAGVARPMGAAAFAPAPWFGFGGNTGGFAIATHAGAYEATKATITDAHRRPGEDAPH